MTMSVSNSAFLHLYQRKSMDLHRHPNRLLYRMYSPQPLIRSLYSNFYPFSVYSVY